MGSATQVRISSLLFRRLHHRTLIALLLLLPAAASARAVRTAAAAASGFVPTYNSSPLLRTRWIAASSSSSSLPMIRSVHIPGHGNSIVVMNSVPLLQSTRLFQQQRSGREDEELENAGNGSSSSGSAISSSSSSLSRSYQIGQYLFGATAVRILTMPDRTMTTLLATKWGGAAGFGLASGVCHILKQQLLQSKKTTQAAVEEKDSSDDDDDATYQRLSLGLLMFSLIGLTAIPGEAGFLNTAASAMVMTLWLTALRLYGAMIAYTGWKQQQRRNVSNTNTMGAANATTTTMTARMQLNDLVAGLKATLAGLRVRNTKKALTYRNCLLLVGLGTLSSLMEGIFYMRYHTEFIRTGFEISLQWSAVSRLVFIASMIYSLKDGAERDKLRNRTYMQLNLMVGAWAVLVGIGQFIYPLGVAFYRGVEMFAFAFPFFLRAFKSQIENDKAKREAKAIF
jgi:hypothetical protein